MTLRGTGLATGGPEGPEGNGSLRNVGVIIGAVFGGVAGFLVAGIAIVELRRRLRIRRANRLLELELREALGGGGAGS